MGDHHSLLYSYPSTSSDETIYSRAADMSQPAVSQTAGHKHRRSASLLGRLRHQPGGASPTSSPTSECSSRDGRSERTLAHSASSGSMRQRPAVRVLPPPPSQPGAPPGGKKRGQARGDGAKSSGGFISQLLRGNTSGSSAAARSPASPRAPSPVGAGDGLAQFVRSAGGAHKSPVAGTGALEAEAAAAARSQHFGPASLEQPQQAPWRGSGYPAGAGFTPAYYGLHHYHASAADESQLLSALPAYEAIDVARLDAARSACGGRATQPALPDTQMLAPMASLAELLPELGGRPGGGALSSRELRFAVENHMLVEQHRYLIRDLGHARSAIAALKAVVQAKEERVESFELAHAELQQRVAELEALLGEQRRASRSSARSSASMSPASEPPPEPADEPRGSRRPLSGYVTGYAFSERGAVSALPRVFSGDYSAAQVQAMESSVEALASAIAHMPRDEASVADIIASKPRGDEPAAEAVPAPRRASRLFAALRLPAFHGADPPAAATASRRSVSLGSASLGSEPPRPAARRQASADSLAGGRYPASLGLGDAAPAPRPASSASRSSANDAPRTGRAPRRSTSAPSRPQSVRVARRRSWLLQLFAPAAARESAASEPAGADAERARRRVVTQSAGDVARLLGALALDDRGAGLADVGEGEGEEERAVSVAEMRQQTLDALNGAQPAARWRAQDTQAALAAAPTIMRLNPPPPLGLGVSVAPSRRGSLPPDSDRRSQAWAPPFWAPPPPPAATWSPRDSASAWEMVKPSPPEPRTLGFFEDTTVPDSDELTMAARRSLSLRMSRSAFKQAEPLPESDDAAADAPPPVAKPPLRNAALARVAAAEPKRRSLLWQFSSSKSAAHANLSDLPASDCASVASNEHASAANAADDATLRDASAPSIKPAATNSLSTTNNLSANSLSANSSSTNTSAANSSTANSSTAKRPKKWWTAVLGQ
ncbi:hypothetical protein GGI04_001966 [Coemansia thaxteri]|nr:hypothetical protein GGI04_001966 [Coemansia thaxteri]KAJ2472038.1 hypothetical protein GGI02_001862 [Coemansia sp. RSA 2322]